MSDTTEAAGWIDAVTLSDRQTVSVRLSAVAAIVELRDGGTRLLFHAGGTLDICGNRDHWETVIVLAEAAEATPRSLRLSAEEIAVAQKDADRYRWLLAHANNEYSHDSDGEEINTNPWLHFDDTKDGETISESIDRHIATGDTNAVS